MNNEQIKKEFTVPADSPKDLELMSIWAQAAEAYSPELTPAQFRAAVNWFKSYIDIRMDDRQIPHCDT